MTPKDSLSLLLSLPASRLCQLLCLLSRQYDLPTAWASLVWIECERPRIPPLSGPTRQKWKRELFPGSSLERLLTPNQPFNSTVLEVVTDTVFGILFTDVGGGPGSLAMSNTLESWEVESDHVWLSLTAFLESLPGTSAAYLLDLPGSDFLRTALQKSRRPPEHQRIALLLQVLLQLYHGGGLSESMLNRLYQFETTRTRKDWQELQKGLRRFSQSVPARHRTD